ncbi:MAG: electron transport complex subunit RsxC [Candidatus Omnitrophota bacterium]|nr:electron transport complex subunit RsxC [Candidatus Omnitrophota bacterium]
MIKLKEHKHATENKKIEKLPLPSKVYIPLSQALGKASAPCVQIGDPVLIGQKIAVSSATISSNIHSSISGKVSAIQDWPHSVLGETRAIVIESDGLEERGEKKEQRIEKEADKLTPEQIRNIIFEAGIVGMGGASFPTHIKLNPPKPVDTLIINCAECEPYLTCDYRLMLEKTREILQGISLAAKCLGVKKIYIAIEDNKPEAIKQFGAQVSEFVIKILKSQYPQGGEKQLIKNVLGKEVPSGKLPFDVGVVVHNVGTIYAIYEAVYLNKPLYERLVSVTGSCISNPKNLLAPIGTPIKELINFCSPLKHESAKIIIGGPMMGIAQWTDEVPLIKSTTGVILFNEKEAKAREEEACIRCGACISNCPMRLMPCLINLSSEKEMWQEAKAYNALDCIECGLCNYVCPANRMLVQSIKRAKLEAVK